jgi:hypothetical protein
MKNNLQINDLIISLSLGIAILFIVIDILKI